MSSKELQALLLSRANVEPVDLELPLKADEQDGRELFETLLMVFLQKGRLYGNHRLKMPLSPRDYAPKMLFADIERKFRRYQHFTWHGQEEDAGLVLETLGDMIVHSAVAILALNARREQL